MFALNGRVELLLLEGVRALFVKETTSSGDGSGGTEGYKRVR